MNEYYESRTDMVDLNDNPGESTLKAWAHLSDVRNWRITQLPNGYYQSEVVDPHDEYIWHGITRRSCLDDIEEAVYESVCHYRRKAHKSGFKTIIKTFK